MISKIIQKEKDVQKGLINRVYDSSNDFNAVTMLMDFHKDTLINLKEYMEAELIKINFCSNWDYESDDEEEHINQIKEDIRELNKMIERYK